MKLKPVIDRLKASAPTFGGRVAGTAEFAIASQADELAVPHAFVVPLGEVVADNATMNMVVQPVTDVFGVIVAVSNLGDDRGQAASEQLDDLRTELHVALLGWEPSAEHGHSEYRGAIHLGMNRGRLWHQFEFGSLWVAANL